MFRKIYLLMVIRSVSKSLKIYSNTSEGKTTLDLFYNELQDKEYGTIEDQEENNVL